MIRKDTTRKPKAAIYVRVSTEEQAKEGYSLSAQESALKDYSGMMGYDVFKIYRDEGKSAKDINHRPALQQLLKDAEKKSYKAIFVYKLDRFSRSLKDLILTIEMLKRQNIDFISMQDKIETASASGKLMFHIISSFAEFERDIISERTRFGMIEKAKEGGVVSKAAFGYLIKDGKFIVDESRRHQLESMFKDYLETDKSLNMLAREHNLTVRGLIKVLTNRIYIGEIRFKDNYSSDHERLIDKDIFDRVQAKLCGKSHERVLNRYKTFLSGFGVSKEINERLAYDLSKKVIEHQKVRVSLIDDNSDMIQDIHEPQRKHKYAVLQYLLEQGYSEDDISYDRVFVNADKTDMFVNAEKRIYIDFTPLNLPKIYDYMDNDVEYWLASCDEACVDVYMFRKSE